MGIGGAGESGEVSEDIARLAGLADGFNDGKIDVKNIRSDGTSAWLDFEYNGGGDIPFNDGKSLDCTTGDGPGGIGSVELMQGSNEIPMWQFVYMLWSENDQAVIAVTSQIIPDGVALRPIAYVLCPTAAKVVADSSSIFIQRITDTVTDGFRSALSFEREKLRLALHNNRIVGCDLSMEITTNVGTQDNINIISIPGSFYQLHLQKSSWAGYDISTYGIRVIGQAVGLTAIPNNELIFDIGDIRETSEGEALVNGDSIYLDIVGIGTSCDCKKMGLIISKNKFANASDAIAEAKTTGNMRYPSSMDQVCFTLGRAILTYSTADGGTWTNALGSVTSQWTSHTVNDSQTGYAGYSNNMAEIFSSHTYPGASHVRAYCRVDTEANYDFANFRNGSTSFPSSVTARRSDPLSYSGNLGWFHSEVIPGDTLRCQFTSDGSVIGGDGVWIQRIEALMNVSTGQGRLLDLR